MKRSLHGLLAALLIASPAFASASIQVSEWMYDGKDGEFIEFTNIGHSAVDFAGWSFDDDSRVPGTVSLSAFGVLGAGQSVILTESDAASFRSAWKLDASIGIIGGNTTNLGRSDEINLYDGSGTLVERFAYGDQKFAGTLRTQNRSGNPSSLAALLPDSVDTQWTFAASGDVFGSYQSASGDLGNPGHFIYAPVPEPETYALMLAGLALLGTVTRKRPA